MAIKSVPEQAKTSLFTHFLLEGIKSGEADRDGDSLITLDEWYDYTYDKVVGNLPTQTPRRWVYNQLSTFQPYINVGAQFWNGPNSNSFNAATGFNQQLIQGHFCFKDTRNLKPP